MSSLYMRATPDAVGKYVIFSGDPWRVNVVKQYLENPVEVAFSREFNTYTGTYKGVKITVTSTIVPIGAMRREATSKTYVEESYPAVADVGLVNILNRTITDHGRKYLNGISCTMDGFYTQMHDSRFSLESGRDMKPVFDQLKALHVSGIDMESSCMLTVGRLMGVKTAVLTVVTVLENLKKTLEGQERLDAEDLLCRIALEAIWRYAQEA